MDRWKRVIGVSGSLGRLTPDQSFDTLACMGGETLSQRLAALEGARACRVYLGCRGADLAERLAAAPCASVVRTLSIDGEGTVCCSPLRDIANEVGAGKKDAAEKVPAGGRSSGCDSSCDGHGSSSELAPVEGGAGAATGRSLLVVDNSLAGPYLCRPLPMGVHVVIEDLGFLLGVEAASVLAMSDSILDEVEELSTDLCVAGIRLVPHGVPGVESTTGEASGHDPEACRAALALLPSLSAVSQRKSDTALAVANYLVAHPSVREVSYPGLAQDPANEGARKVLAHGFGPVLTFALARGGAADVLAGLDGCGIVLPAMARGATPPDDGHADSGGADATASLGALASLGASAPCDYLRTTLSAIAPDRLALVVGMESPLDVVGGLESCLAVTFGA